MKKFFESALDVVVLIAAIYFALQYFAPDTLNNIISRFSPNSTPPEQVVANLFDYVAKGDGKTAVKYLYIDESLSENEKQQERAHYADVFSNKYRFYEPKGGIKGVSIQSVNTSGNNSIVYYVILFKDGDHSDVLQAELVKVGRHWKITNLLQN